MKKQDIRNAYTQKVTELLNQGYTIFRSQRRAVDLKASPRDRKSVV